MIDLRWPLAAAIAAVLTGTAPGGDRELRLVFSNFTPDAIADAASDQCVERIVGGIRDGYVELRKLGESKLRSLMGKPQGSGDFITWSSDVLRRAKEEPLAYPDAVVLVDCRPTTGTLKALVVPVDPRERRVLVHADLTDEGTTRVVGRRLQDLAWAGFTP